MDGTAVLGTLLGHRIGRPRPVQESGLTFSEEPPAPFAGSAAEQTVGPAASDAELAAACRSSNLAAYEQLYATHGARMKGPARNLLGNAHDAEDVVQEAFLKVHRSIASYRVEARTSFGHVTTDFPITISGTTGGDSLSGTIGGSACQLCLTNSNSSIEVLKSAK